MQRVGAVLELDRLYVCTKLTNKTSNNDDEGTKEHGQTRLKTHTGLSCLILATGATLQQALSMVSVANA